MAFCKFLVVPRHASNDFAHFLQSDDLNLARVKQLLEQDSSYVNKVTILNETPLLVVLKNRKCSVDIVKLFLQHNANINCKDTFGNNCLLVALSHLLDKAIIRLLLENGADINSSDRVGRSPVCVAFRFCASRNIVKLLLDKGCSPNACRLHISLMHCALDRPLKILTDDFLEHLLNVGGNLNSIDSQGQSPLCLALMLGLSAQAIQLMLSKGALLDACEKHASAMLCATDRHTGYLLKADLVKLLIKQKVSLNDEGIDGFTPLQSAVFCSRYETKAIKMLLEKLGGDFKSSRVNGGNLLHLAVSNPHCKLRTVKALLDQGVRVDELNSRGQTPLLLALMQVTANLRPGIIEVLLKNGSPVNGKCDTNETPMLAAINNLDCYMFKVLFAAGASSDLFEDGDKTYLLNFIFDNCTGSPCPEKLEFLKMLLKCSILEIPDFDVQDLSQNCRDNAEFFSFADECGHELGRMESQNVGYMCTLREFVSEYHFPHNIAVDCSPKMINYNLDLLLEILVNNDFPIYLDIILAKIGREPMKDKLEKTYVYTSKVDPSSPSAQIFSVLDYPSVCHVTQFLSDKDMMRFMLAYVNHQDIFDS